MAALTPSQVTDLSNTTLSELGRFKMVDLTTDLREHVAMSNLMTKNRVSLQSGKDISWNVLENNDDNARNVGLYSRNNTNVKDGSLVLTIPWRQTETSCAYDVVEAALNRAPAQVVNFVNEKIQMSRGGLAELMEANWWQGVSSSADDTTPWGLFGYWLDGSNLSSTFDFDGSNGNYGSIGGQDADVHTRLKHGSYDYTNVTDTDLVDGLRDCIKLSEWMPTVKNAKIPGYSNGERRVMYSGWTTCKALAKLARSNNESLGSDLDAYGDTTRVMGVPVREVPYITKNKTTSLPVVGIDWKQVHTCILSGHFGTQTPFRVAPTQNSVRESFTRFVYNYRIWDRRKGIFLAAKSDPLSS